MLRPARERDFQCYEIGFLRRVASSIFMGGPSWAQTVGGGNGPITGIPSGLGANGSETFTPGPANQLNPGGPGAMGGVPAFDQPLGPVRRCPRKGRPLSSPPMTTRTVLPTRCYGRREAA